MLIGVIGSETKLRSVMSTTKLTAAEFDYLVKHPNECPEELKEHFNNLIAGKKRSQSAMQAVVTKRKKYKTWPSRKNDHK